jgi:hypothetical protein
MTDPTHDSDVAALRARLLEDLEDAAYESSNLHAEFKRQLASFDALVAEVRRLRGVAAAARSYDAMRDKIVNRGGHEARGLSAMGNVYPLVGCRKVSVSVDDDVRVWLDRLIGAWDDAYAAGRDDEAAGRASIRRNPYCTPVDGEAVTND